MLSNRAVYVLEPLQLGDEFPSFETACGRLAKGECKRSTTWLKKAGLVHNLIEKI
jgi:hypothetical protein